MKIGKYMTRNRIMRRLKRSREMVRIFKLKMLEKLFEDLKEALGDHSN